MPPKQKQVKKGPSYKPATPFKDMVPPTIKEPPRDSKPLKVPESQPQPQDKNSQNNNQIPVLFQEWPTEQAIKSHDFGIASENKFQDKSHDIINEFVKEDLQSKQSMFNWKYLHEIHNIQEKQKDQQDSESDEEEGHKSSVNLQGQQKNKSENMIQQNKNKPMAVIETYLRQQTEQQMEKRKKQEAQKLQKAAKDKKKGKKQEPKQEGPLQVSDVKMSNIVSRKYMCPSGIWIGSQLQIIKIRNLKDVYTDEPVWKKIYPQQNGVPQITKSGKYWVKLYYMGKPVKIQIDDRVPLGHNTKNLFPKSQKPNQKWTLILTKALLKLFALSNPKSSVIGSGLIINALTGMITQNLKIRSFSDWKRLEQMMNDEHYNKKDIIINCYSINANRKSPSNFIRNKQQMKDIISLENSTFKKKSNRRNSAVELVGMKNNDEVELAEEKIQEQYVESNLLPGYAYCIGDYFFNDQFNMVFSKQKNARQQKLKFQYNQMSKVALGNKSREQKLEHRKKKKQIKQKLQVEQKKRYQLIKKPIVKYHFVKLLSDLLINCEYSHKQILLAKKCKLNGLQHPPNYEIPVLEKGEKEKQESKMGSTTAIKFKQDNQINAPLDDFSTVQNIKQFQTRQEEGIWIKNEDLITIFDQFQFLFNPNIFQFKSIQFVNNKFAKQFTTDENKQILVIEKKGNPHLQQKEQAMENQQTQKIALLFGFGFQQSKWDTLCDPYCMLQKFDFESFRTASNVMTLSQPLSGTYLTLNNQNSVFRIYTISKGKYAYWISSDSKYKLLSIADYLTEFQAYTSKNFTVEYPAMEKKTYLTISRLKIKHTGQQNNIVYLKIKNCPKDIEKYLTVKIVSIPEEGQYTNEEQEGVIVKKQQSTHIVYEYSRAELAPNKNYSIIFEAYPVENIAEGTLQIQILSKFSSNVQLSQSDQIQPYKVLEKYIPNKYGVILKQRLFCNNNINASIMVKIFQGEEGQPVQTDKKASKKGGKEQQTFQIIEKQLAQKRLIHVKLFKNGSLIYYGKDYNQVIISNIQFEKTKENVIYYLQASFDLRQWPSAAVASQQTSKICWLAQVTGQDAIAFVKDTLQQEKQKQTRKSWQDKQPGRAQKAKKARQRFLLQLKQQKGQSLTEQQLQLVNAPKMTKKKLLQQQKKNEDKKGGKGAKKDDKKGAKDKKQEVIEQKKQQRPQPKSSQNYMKQVKQFLKNLESCKIHKQQLKQGSEARIRSDEQQNSIKQGALMSKENRAAQIIRNIQTRQLMKIKQKDKKDKLTILLQDSRANFNSEWKQYIQWRIQDQEKDKTKIQKEKGLIDLINQQKVTLSQADVNKLITEYRGIEGHNPLLADVVDMIRKNIKISNVIDRINTALEGWEVDALKNIQQQIKNDKIQGINEQISSKMGAMLDEAAKNPAIVAQKQAELKKIKKPGKK